MRGVRLPGSAIAYDLLPIVYSLIPSSLFLVRITVKSRVPLPYRPMVWAILWSMIYSPWSMVHVDYAQNTIAPSGHGRGWWRIANR